MLSVWTGGGADPLSASCRPCRGHCLVDSDDPPVADLQGGALIADDCREARSVAPGEEPVH